MNDFTNGELIVPKNEISDGIGNYNQTVVSGLTYCGLPTDHVFVPVDERIIVVRNLEQALKRLSSKKLSQSLYISKFVAAVCAGLFDAALNYLWDETVNQLRSTVIQFDLEYFYDLVCKDSKRKYSKEEDLVKVTDSNLIEGCRKMGLISDVGFKLLENINYMRNWASAAHPNQSEITGFQLIGWLDTCIREVISLPLSDLTISTQKLFENIKSKSLDSKEAKRISSFFNDLSPEMADHICNGMYGIYCRETSSADSRKNIKMLLPDIWNKIDSESKASYGIKYGRAEGQGDRDKAALARGFLQIVDGESYIPESIKIVELNDELENLHDAHVSFNNFYNEAGPARQIRRLVNDEGVPKEVLRKYSTTITEVYLTNGYGECWEAKGIYEELINMFTDENYAYVVTSFLEDHISSKFSHSLCETKYIELLERGLDVVVRPQIKDLISKILSSEKKPKQLSTDPAISKLAKELRAHMDAR